MIKFFIFIYRYLLFLLRNIRRTKRGVVNIIHAITLSLSLLCFPKATCLQHVRKAESLTTLLTMLTASGDDIRFFKYLLNVNEATILKTAIVNEL